jgi:replicative DNA helicase
MPTPPSLEPVTPAPDTPAPPRLLLLGSLIDAFAADAQARHDAFITGRPLGPVLPFGKVNIAMGGAFAPGVHIVHGSPGVGKTAFGLQVAATCLCPALYITCEMSPLELLRRHTARVTKTDISIIKSGQLLPHDVLVKAQQAVADAPHLALLDATQAPATPAAILTAAETTRQIDPENPHLLIVVDSLHSWADGLPDGDGLTEYDRLNDALASLRLLAKRLDCPVLAIAERNRGAMRSGGQNAGAGTRKIEYGAETVLELDVRADSTGAPMRPGPDGERQVGIKLSKNRHGANMEWTLLFHGGFQRFREVTP